MTNTKDNTIATLAKFKNIDQNNTHEEIISDFLNEYRFEKAEVAQSDIHDGWTDIMFVDKSVIQVATFRKGDAYATEVREL